MSGDIGRSVSGSWKTAAFTIPANMVGMNGLATSSLLVLLGSPNDDQGNLLAVAETRVAEAVKAHKEGPARALLPTGGFGVSTPQQTPLHPSHYVAHRRGSEPRVDLGWCPQCEHSRGCHRCLPTGSRSGVLEP